MDIGKAISFVFEDEKWIGKILLGALITLIPIFGQLALFGYAIAVLRNVRAGDPRPLPLWENLGQYFMDGLMFWIISFIYSIPMLIFLCPLMLIGPLAEEAGGNGDFAGTLAAIVGICGGCPTVLYGILLWLLSPVLQIYYAKTGELGACLKFREVFRYLFDNIGSIVVSQLVLGLAAMVLLPLVSVLTLGLLALPASVWLTVASSHLYGQISRQAEGSMSGI